MNSTCVVAKYPVISRGKLEWTIENVGFHFKKCIGCFTNKSHNSCAIRDFETIQSRSMKLEVGGGRYSKWNFVLRRTWDNPVVTFGFSLYFRGLFGSDEIKLNESVTFHYDAVVEKWIGDGCETLLTADDIEKNKSNAEIVLEKFQIEKLRSIWPLGSLKISVEILQLSDRVEEIVNNGPFLDLLDLKDSLSSCYGNFMNNPDLSDFKIICGGSTFHAHKFILSVRSRVFRAMLEAGMSESFQNELEIEDMTLKTVELMLEYIYKGSIENFPEDLKDKIELLDCTEKYELDGLKSICMRQLFSNPPTEKDVGELAMAASIYGANERAIKAIKDFCMKNHVKLVQNPEYKKLFLANPQAFL